MGWSRVISPLGTGFESHTTCKRVQDSAQTCSNLNAYEKNKEKIVGKLTGLMNPKPVATIKYQ